MLIRHPLLWRPVFGHVQIMTARGRPKLDTTKDKMLGVRLSPDERELMDSAAKKAGKKNASEWAREILLAEAGKKV